MVRVPMNIVPLVPITMVRAPGCPLDQTSTLKPGGSLILSSGSLSTAVASGGNGCGRRLPSCPLPPGFERSSGLKPGCASAVATPIVTIAAAPSMDRMIVFMNSSLTSSLTWPSSNPGETTCRRFMHGACFAGDVIEARPGVNFHVERAEPRQKAPHCSIERPAMRSTAQAEPGTSYFCRNPPCYPWPLFFVALFFGALFFGALFFAVDGPCALSFQHCS